jgi:micrococcal nuclease
MPYVAMTRRGLSALVCALAVVGCQPVERPESVAGAPSSTVGVVDRVTDGDTIVVSGTKVRLIGIDTPETVHPSRPVECFGPEASAAMTRLLPPGTQVRLVPDVESADRFQRTLSYVYRSEDDLFVNVEMARLGYAQQLTIPPNVARAEQIGRAVREAREAGRGLWGAGCEG